MKFNSILTLACLSGTLLFVGCDSPMSLDVNRTTWYADGAVHPSRLQFFYYFADSAYEAIVTDTSFLNQIWIERSQSPWTITVPQFLFQLPSSVRATSTTSPLVRSFCFGFDQHPVDGLFRSCINMNSWLEGEFIESNLTVSPFHWMANTSNRQILIAWYKPIDNNLLKGRIVIRVQDPVTYRLVSYNALLTLEY